MERKQDRKNHDMKEALNDCIYKQLQLNLSLYTHEKGDLNNGK